MTDIDPALDDFLADVEQLALDDPDAALELLDEASPAWHDHPELHFIRGDLLWGIRGPEAAEPHFRSAVARDPKFADGWHALGQVHEALGDHPEVVRCFLEVLRLDAHDDIGAGIGTREDRRFIAAVAEEVLEHIPEEFRDRIGNVPVVLEPRPARYLVEEGFDPRALGLFEGPTHFNQRGTEAAAAPSRIVLFYANLLASYPDEDDLREQVEVTILHEIGHYFGLDEDDMERLGLD